jgi:starch synthase (maltosyl-transferring)
VQIDDDDVIGFVRESTANDNAVAMEIALGPGPPRQFWLHFGDLEIGPTGERRQIRESKTWRPANDTRSNGAASLDIDQNQDAAPLFRCFP